ncbi:MAG: hypothetical protein ABJH98_12120 [Reichenbachiella sp.]|uniref:hypothetical protein n=1 Tax=Reichenbachiella sp. TaxID=2184521 RepID=UPI0032989F4A
MRTLLTISSFFWVFGLFAQSSDSLGVDDNPILNDSEVQLLSSLLSESRNDFDFTDKKVAFITGSNGRTIVSKSEYFKNSVIPWIEKDSEPQIFMVELTEGEKNESGGYDVIVLSWVKIFTPKSQERAIQYLGNKK